LHLDMRYADVLGTVVTRRCAESFRYFRRADIVGEAMLN
jgi:hypothetical protein